MSTIQEDATAEANRLSLEAAVGHLLCPLIRPEDFDDLEDRIAEERYGSVFFNKRCFDEMRGTVERIQNLSTHPVLVAADLEHGATAVTDRSTRFPWAMALAASGDPSLARAMGEAAAREARAAGIHWGFAPVVDINYNFRAPESNIRTFGDDPETVAAFASELIHGLQSNGEIAATPKHFPGTGLDERDQHLVTAVNKLSVDAWLRTYGRVWKRVIEADAWSIMSGHVSFPAWQGFSADPTAALPATLCPRLQIDLLRRELGFEGVLVSDAAPMIGLCSRVPEKEAALRFIEAGGDVFLFAQPGRDHPALLDAVRTGRLSEARVYESAARVVALKRKLGLDRRRFGDEPGDAEQKRFAASARSIAEKSITVLKDNGRVGHPPPEGGRVLTVTIDSGTHKFHPPELDVFDDLLRKAGYRVTHLRNPGGTELRRQAPDFDCVFLNFHLLPHMEMGHTRLFGASARHFWRAFYTSHPDVRCTSFGSPYLLFDQPHLPNMLLAYGGVEASQEAALAVWLGRRRATGTCPVRQPEIRISEDRSYEIHPA